MDLRKGSGDGECLEGGGLEKKGLFREENGGSIVISYLIL